VKWGVAGALSFCGIGMALVRISYERWTSRSWAFSGLPAVVGIALLSTAQLIGLEPRSLQLISGTAMVLSAISLVFFYDDGGAPRNPLLSNPRPRSSYAAQSARPRGSA